MSRGVDRADRPWWASFAPAAALLATTATWLHYLLTGSVQLGGSPRGTALTLASAVAGAALLGMGGCCVAAYRSAARVDPRTVLAAGLAVRVVLLPALPLFSSDLFSYLANGELVARGLNPHVVGPAALGDSPLVPLTLGWRNTPSPYGPVATLLSAVGGLLGAALGSPLWINGLCHKLLVGALDLGSVVLAHRLTRERDDPGARAGFVVFALNPLVPWELSGQGHNDALVVASLVAFLWAARRGRAGAGTFSLAVGSLSKFVPGPVLVLYLLHLGRRSWTRALRLLACCVAAAAALYVPFWHGAGTVAFWREPTVPRQIFAIFSLDALALRLLAAVLGPGGWLELTHRAFVGAGLLATGLSFVVVARRPWRDDGLPHAALTVIAVALATRAWLQPWYFTWIVPFALVLDDRRWLGLLLGLTVVAAPSLSAPGLWLVLPLAQLALLAAAWRWWPRPPPVEAAAPALAA